MIDYKERKCEDCLYGQKVDVGNKYETHCHRKLRLRPGAHVGINAYYPVVAIHYKVNTRECRDSAIGTCGDFKSKESQNV